MSIELSIAHDFGSHLANGADAAEYRRTRIEPYVDLCEKITLDFTGVRLANSSFINALVCGLIEQHGESVLKILEFRGCNQVLQVLIQAAVDLGLYKITNRIDA